MFILFYFLANYYLLKKYLTCLFIEVKIIFARIKRLKFMIPVHINGIEYSVPRLKVTNDDISKIVDTSDDWIIQRTGIKSRYIASSSETASTLAIDASKKLLERKNINPETIDMIISATSSPEKHYPSVACEVQAGIGAKNASAEKCSLF